MPVSIGLVEDDDSIAWSITDALTHQGYRVDRYRDGTTAMFEFEESVPDLVLLDAALPDVDGFSVCRWLRARQSELPIVLVTARDSDIDIVVGLDAGASDYVTKPFSMDVLLARVRAHLRGATSGDPEVAIELGTVRVDAAAYVVTVGGARVDLRPREFELLLYLCREAGRVVTRQRLLADLWDLKWDTSSRTLEMHIHAIRRKLGNAIELSTVRGVGYRLNAP